MGMIYISNILTQFFDHHFITIPLYYQKLHCNPPRSLLTLKMDFEFNNESVCRATEKLYLDVTTADVYFTFGANPSEKVAAHKAILSVGSAVFQAMFYGELKEKGDVKIVDASISAFKEFLQFFYQQNVRLTLDNIAEVANFCKKYDVNDGLNAAEMFLKKALTPNNVCWAYGIAQYLELTELIEYCESIIAGYGSEVLNSAALLECERKLLASILQLASPKCSAWDFVMAIMNWSKAECTRKKLGMDSKELRGQLGGLYDEIPFSDLTIEQFAQHIALFRGFFTVQEIQDNINKITCKTTASTGLTNGDGVLSDVKSTSKDVLAKTEVPSAPSDILSAFNDILSTTSNVLVPSDAASTSSNMPPLFDVFRTSSNVSSTPNGISCTRRSPRDFVGPIDNTCTTFSTNKKLRLTEFAVRFEPTERNSSLHMLFDISFKRHDSATSVPLIENLRAWVRKDNNELRIVLLRKITVRTDGIYEIHGRVVNDHCQRSVHFTDNRLVKFGDGIEVKFDVGQRHLTKKDFITELKFDIL